MNTHIGDADALIAMFSKDDIHHQAAKAIIQKAITEHARILFPATAITEAITTMHVRLKNPQLAKQAASRVATSALSIAPIDAKILEQATAFYNPEGSRKNTMFDAVVAATAQIYGTKTIFSFDRWYKSLGFTLLADVAE